jgi:hypothetical protein
MAVFMGPGRQREPGSGQVDGSDAYKAWLDSSPLPGEAFGDTGLASAADCQKLRWSPGSNEEALLSKLMQSAVLRNRHLLDSGSLEAEAARVNNLAADALISAGLDPTRFGISLPGNASEPPNGGPTGFRSGGAAS